MSSLFMALFGMFLVLLALGLWLMRGASERAQPLGMALLSSRPAEYAITARSAAVLVAGVGLSIIALSVPGL